MQENAVALKVDNMNLADAMGFSAPAGQAQSSLPRIKGTVIQEVIDGKVASSPVFEITTEEDKVFARKVEVRLFAERQKWQRWDSDNNTMQKTELTTDLKGDLKDSQGGFNLGRPTGFVKDWDALPQETKELMRQVKRTKVVFGTVSLNTPVDSDGNSIDSTYEDIAMIMDIKNRDSIKALDAMVKRVQGLNALPLNYQLKMSAEEHTLPTGNAYYSMVFSLQNKQDIVPSDSDLTRGFLDWIKWANSYVYDQWAEHNNKKVDEDIADFVNEKMSDAKEPGWLDVKGAAV